MATPTVTLDTPYPLAGRDRATFAEQGFVRLPSVVTGEIVGKYEPEITRIVTGRQSGHVPLPDRDTYGRAFLQVTNLWRDSEKVRELVFAQRFAQLATELLGVTGVRLYHDQALYKEPGGGHTPWHADRYYWPLVGDRCCTLWLPLQNTPLAMGPLGFAAGSHRFEYGRDLPISDTSEAMLGDALAGRAFPVVEQPYALGEASYHLGWTFHRAAPNRTATLRRAMAVIYVDADIVISEPVNEHQKADLAAWFPGSQPGQVPDTALNPVLYRV
ncbi:MAG TPA: phytanoyl-CoA dioxygenase family protein [Micromonosporaceae bacterium]